MTQLSLTIDLQAELLTITRRQHLNQVHYAVQLIRHALLHGPRTIHVVSSPSTFELSHDGAPWQREELDLITTILSTGASIERQDALSLLEKRHGIAMLSLFAQADRVEVSSARSLAAERGVLVDPPASRVPGARLRVWRVRGSSRAERAELVAYCRHADARLTYNGRRVHERWSLSRSWRARPVASDDGDGLVGLADPPGLSRVSYYKHGVYYGLRQSVPDDGVAVTAAWNSRLPHFEENFRTSTSRGNDVLEAASRALLVDAARELPRLRRREQERVKSLILGSTLRTLPPALAGLRLFHTAVEPWRLSLDDLAAEQAARGFVTYVPRGASPAAPELAVLSPDELRFLERRLGKGALRRALVVDRGPWSTLRRALERTRLRLERAAERASDSVPTDALPLSTLPPLLVALAGALRERGLDLVVTPGAVHEVTARGARAVVYIGKESPLLATAAAAWARTPEHVDVVVALLQRPG